MIYNCTCTESPDKGPIHPLLFHLALERVPVAHPVKGKARLENVGRLSQLDLAVHFLGGHVERIHHVRFREPERISVLREPKVCE